MELMPADPYVPLIVIGLIVIILFLAGRPRRTETFTESPDEPPTGADLIEHLQRTLGIAIVVESIGSAERSELPDTVTIQATLMSGSHSTRVSAAGPTESDAWSALARAAIAWRNSDFQHVPMWWGSG